MDPTQYQQAIKDIESGGGNYGALGPVTDSGDRAYGAYQVMGNNIPDWTEKHYGTRLTPQQFLQNKAAQDAVFNGEFGSYLNKYGNHDDAASMWFSGRPMAKAGNASDGYNTVPQYVAKFRQALAGPGALSAAPGILNAKAEDTGDGESEDANAPNGTPPVLQTLMGADKGNNKIQTIGQGLVQAGAALAGITSPGQAYSLTQQLAQMKKDTESKYKMMLGKNGEVYRFNPDDGSVDISRSPYAPESGTLPQMAETWGDRSLLKDPNDPKQVEAFFNSMNNPQKSDMVRGILENRLPAPTAAAYAKKDSPWPSAFAAARAIDPQVDPVMYAGRQAGAREAATKVAETARAANQTLEHQGDVLVDAIKSMNNSQSPIVNAGKNWWNTQVLGHAEVGNFKTTAHAAADEMAKLFKGAGISDTEIKHWQENLPDNMSMEQARGQMKTFAKLMQGGFDALEQKRRLEVGKYAADRMEPLIGDKAKAALAKLNEFADSGPNGFNTGKKPQQADLFKFLPIGQ